MTVAVVTMVYNEHDMLGWWLRHYSAQVGLQNCYIIDHGSNDGSTRNIANASVIRLPRTARGTFTEGHRAEFVSNICNELLRFYDWVIYTDVDEMVVADPSRYKSLEEYCSADHSDVVTTIGLNVLHRLHHEVEIGKNLPILGQRQWVFALASMSKPVLTRIPIQWVGGFHSSQAEVVFDSLFNFHIAYFDLATTLKRQAKRRSSRVLANDHHVMSDDDVFHMMENWSKMPTISDISLDASCENTQTFIKAILDSRAGRELEPYKTDMNIWNDKLWKVPQRFFERV